METHEGRRTPFVFGSLKAIAPPLDEAIIFVGIGYKGEDIKVLLHTVGQHTGVVDANGIGIYEGDTLRSDSGELFAVKFADGAFWYADEIASHSLCEFSVTQHQLTIVGNIYSQHIFASV